MANVLRNEPCKRCRGMGNDKSGNNLVVYDNESSHCFACGYTILSEDYKREHGIGEFESELNKEFEYVATDFTIDDWVELKAATSLDGKGYRGLSKSTTTKYGVRHEFDTNTGEVVRQYYPVSQGGKFSGVKVREHPKIFSSVGVTGKAADLFGQACFLNAPKRAVVIASGEADCLAAYEMFAENAAKRGYEPIPVVSSTIGENCAAQLRTNYEWLSRFDKIYLIPDQDSAGQAAIPKLVDALPKGKVYIMNLPMKDSNLMLTSGKQKEFISCYFDASVYTPAGIVASSSIYQEIVIRAETEKLPFAPFLGKLNDVLAGGVPFGFIVNILAGSGVGKSSFLNQNVVYWIKDLQEQVAIVSLEADAGAYGEALLSNYVARKVSLIQDRAEKLEFVKSDAVAQAAKELFCREDGSPSFYLLDDRGDFDKLQEKIEQLIIEFGVRVILIDVISDVFSGMSIEQVDLWMKWMKQLVKRYNCIIIQVAHTRKSASGAKAASEGSFITEESLIGSGTQYRSAGINIALQRDKTSEDEVERNTTKVHCLKSRDTGFTGLACELFYDNDTHTLWDKEVYEQQHPHEF